MRQAHKIQLNSVLVFLYDSFLLLEVAGNFPKSMLTLKQVVFNKKAMGEIYIIVIYQLKTSAA